jgi:energy-coupling factor transport system permease protein
MYDFGNGYKLYYDSLYQGGYIILRLVMMLLLTMILTSTSKPLDLTYAFEWFMTPLKLIKFPAHAIAMTISIALRFIPTLLDETSRIMKAQASRGVDFNKGGLIKKFKAVISLIIPLLISSFKRSEELSNAMEARGYDPDKKRSRYRTLSFTYRDLIALLVVLIYFAGFLSLCIFNYNGYEINIIKFIFNVETIF